jgi:acetyl-CoA C-acetyltransferase
MMTRQISQTAVAGTARPSRFALPIDPRTPVLIGVGVADESDDGAEAVDLMVAAARAAAADAGGGRLLGAVQHVAVPRGTWSYSDPGRIVAQRIGAPSARTALYDLGIPQQTLLNAAWRSIRAGELDVALVVGGEARRRAATAARQGGQAGETDQAGARPDEHYSPAGDMVAAAEAHAGIWVPVQQYAMIDNAVRVAEGLSIAQHLDHIAQLWGRFNQVAVDNPRAAFPTPRPASFLRAPGPDNRPLAFPYAKWHSSQWTVDQAAALLLCSAGAAAAHGVSRDRYVFPVVALESSYALPLVLRAEMHRWPAMGVLGRAASAHLDRPLSEIEQVELYSCFPAAVRVQQRELGLPSHLTATLTGGMAFAGGPLNNFTYQAAAVMVDRLRHQPASLGLLTTVSGLLTKPGLGVWSATPPSRPALIADLAGAARAATAAVDIVGEYNGLARVATYTVTYDGLDPRSVAVVADIPDGRRGIALSGDAQLAHESTTVDLIGSPIDVAGSSFELASQQARRS